MADIADMMRNIFTDGGTISMDEFDFEELRQDLRTEQATLRLVPLPEVSAEDAARFGDVPEAKRQLYAQAIAWMESMNVPWTTDPDRLRYTAGRADIASGDGSVVVECGYAPVGRVIAALKAGYVFLHLSNRQPGQALLYTPASVERQLQEERAGAGNLPGEFIKIAGLSGLIEVALQSVMDVKGFGLIPLVLLVAWRLLRQAQSEGLVDALSWIGVIAALAIVGLDVQAYLRNSLILGIIGVIYVTPLVTDYYRLPLRHRWEGFRPWFDKQPPKYKRQMLWYGVFSALVLLGAVAFLVLGITEGWPAATSASLSLALRDWLFTDEGQDAVVESGYVPIR